MDERLNDISQYIHMITHGLLDLQRSHPQSEAIQAAFEEINDFERGAMHRVRKELEK